MKNPNHEGILDYNLALKASAGNEQLAKKLLETFISQIPTYQNEIQACLKNSNTDALQVCIHKLNGAMQYIGVPSLRHITQKLDGHLKLLNQGERLSEINSLCELLKLIEQEQSYN